MEMKEGAHEVENSKEFKFPSVPHMSFPQGKLSLLYILSTHGKKADAHGSVYTEQIHVVHVDAVLL